MTTYILRRLLLLPITLFCIILVNFIIINLAPGDPTTATEISPEGMAARKEGESMAFGSDERYLQFREHYGLTLPILWNSWPWTSKQKIEQMAWALVHRRQSPETEEMRVGDYNALRLLFGDMARFVMPKLLAVIEDPEQELAVRRTASRFFARGGYRLAYLGPNLTEAEHRYNRKISVDNLALRTFVIQASDNMEAVSQKTAGIKKWYLENRNFYQLDPKGWQKLKLLFQTRLIRYLGRVLTLDFGTIRNDTTKTVISEVAKRFKYSLTLALLPMVMAFFLCQLFGFLMAYQQNRWPDYSLNVFFLVLYAVPIFVVVPFLIDKVALNNNFPFTDIPIPISGFTSPSPIYYQEVSYQRLFDVLQHIFLPIVAIMYGTIAASTRLSRTAVLEVLRQDYVRTARAKGVAPFVIMFKHVGRNAAITIITALASSLGVILGGSLIVETLFDINGFGKFFYDAVINRDFNVIMFSAIAGSFLSLLGYLAADLAYTFLDPRITLD